MKTGQDSSFHPLEDRPLGAEELQRFDAGSRLEPTVEALRRQLSHWLKTVKKDRSEPPRIGLYGGLGQGKSTVVGLCLAALDAERRQGSRWARLWDVLLGPPVARFDVSHFKADDLEWRFLTAVLWQRIRHNLLLIGLPALLLLTLLAFGGGAVFAWWDWQSCWDAGWTCLHWTWGAGGIVMAMLLPLLTKLFTDCRTSWKAYNAIDPAKGLYVATRDWLMHEIARLTWALPAVVVVDDLDRARVEQQRAFLRAILRFSRQMRFAVVVCMDESEILASDPDPEAPDELLRKVIQFELRVPDRGREDILCFVAVLCRELSRSAHRFAHTLLSPRWIGDVLRCLLLMQPEGAISPRRVKRLLNDVLAKAEQIGLPTTADRCALLRLECLLRLAPNLRRHNGALLAAMESNRLSELNRALEVAAVEPAKADAARRFFARSRAMQPAANDGWFRILGGMRVAPGNTVTTQEWPEAKLPQWPMGKRSHDFFRLFSASIEHVARGYPVNLAIYSAPAPDDADRYAYDIAGGGQEFFRGDDLPAELLGKGHLEYFAQCWPLWLCVLLAVDPDARAKIYLAGEAWARQSADPEVQKALAEIFLRERLADAEVWRRTPSGEKESLWDCCVQGDSKLAFRRLVLVELEECDGPAALSRLARIPAIDARLAVAWLAGIRAPAIASLDEPDRGSEILARLLPAPLPEGKDDDAWFRTLKAAASAEPLGLKGAPRLPTAVSAAWRLWSGPWLNSAQCLTLLEIAACGGGARDTAWSLARLKPWIATTGNDAGIDNGHEGLPKGLRDLLVPEEGLKLAGMRPESPCKGALAGLNDGQKLAALALAALSRWPMKLHLKEDFTGISAERLFPLLDALLGEPDGAWLQEVDQELLVWLLQSAGSIEDARRTIWQRAISGHLGGHAADLFAALSWPPLVE